MAGAALGQLAGVAMALVGLISVLRARRNRNLAREDRSATPDPDAGRVGRMEMERRMASYLAARDDTRVQGASDERR